MEVKLKHGEITIVDDDIDPNLIRRVWRLRPKGDSGYVVRTDYYNDGTHKSVSLHRLIMNAGVGQQVDHINHDSLDNRRCNLRLCTPNQNAMNRKRDKKGSSRFKGVCLRKNGRWLAHIQCNHKIYHLGYFGSEEDAAKAYDDAAKKMFGEFACLNFQ